VCFYLPSIAFNYLHQFTSPQGDSIKHLPIDALHLLVDPTQGSRGPLHLPRRMAMPRSPYDYIDSRMQREGISENISKLLHLKVLMLALSFGLDGSPHPRTLLLAIVGKFIQDRKLTSRSHLCVVSVKILKTKGTGFLIVDTAPFHVL